MDLVGNEIKALGASVTALEKKMVAERARLALLEPILSQRPSFASEIDEAVYVLKSEALGLGQVLDRFPDLGASPTFWNSFLESKHMPQFPDFAKLLLEYGRQILTGERDLVVRLCSYEPSVYNRLVSPMREHEEVVAATLKVWPLAVATLKNTVQRKHPQLVASAILRLSTIFSRDKVAQKSLRDCIDDSLWMNRDFVKAWGLAGGYVPYSTSTIPMKDDEELLLINIQKSFGSVAFDIVPSVRLCSKKTFMLKAIEANPDYFKYVAIELADDEDLLLAAMCNSIMSPALTRVKSRSFWISKSNIVKTKLVAHEIFVKVILCGMMAKKGNTSPLALLSQGGETSSVAFAKPVAEFLGVPTGTELQILRKARKNLGLSGIHWADRCEIDDNSGGDDGGDSGRKRKRA